ncbi:MAG: N-acetylneuraminate synthase family protein [bacterium]|nr:N-acetylneuraminate synthase family protein [bacterium]
MDLKFGKFRVNKTSPAIIIAEFSDGHQGSLEHAKRLVDAAKASGADMVKFQMHSPEEEMVSGVKMWAGDLQDILKKVWFSPEKHRAIMKYCQKKGIEYLCTPFFPRAIDVLNKMGVKGFKAGSGEIYNLPFHRKLAKISKKTGKPVFISTGMCTMKELEETVSIYKKEGGNFLLMNCTSEYPVKNYSSMRLPLITKFREKFGVWIGQSDHTTDAYTTFAAITLGAKVIEKHFTLDRNGTFPDDSMSLDPKMMRELVDGVRKIEASLQNSKKTINKNEAEIRSWAFHSVVTDKGLKRGDPITTSNVRTARPGWGIPAKYLDKKYSKALLGKKIKKDTPKNTILHWTDIA